MPPYAGRGEMPAQRVADPGVVGRVVEQELRREHLRGRQDVLHAPLLEGLGGVMAGRREDLAVGEDLGRLRVAGADPHAADLLVEERRELRDRVPVDPGIGNDLGALKVVDTVSHPVVAGRGCGPGGNRSRFLIDDCHAAEFLHSLSRRASGWSVFGSRRPLRRST
ncbi:hypothetical protein Asp14428_74640 [Actinoplanes sp. NBRC 14428]|nr:hypothetical protein Asp14428_74640 [Actinoplanes sp. NBRC 14428]